MQMGRRVRMAAKWAASWLLCIAFAGTLQSAEPGKTLRVYLLAGQSNMEGHGYAHQEGDDWLASIGYPDATSIELLVRDADYRARLDPEVYRVLAEIDESWLGPRDDVWAVHRDSVSGEPFVVQHTPKAGKAEWTAGEKPLQPGFGNAGNELCKFGPELGLGHRLGAAVADPIYLFKSDHGGTSLAVNWRPPSAAKARGGETGANYLHTVEAFRAFLRQLDEELAADGVLEQYGGATAYEVCGFVWVHGWNDFIDEQRRREYRENLLDLVHDLRSDLELPGLPAVIVESADMNDEMNAARRGAVEALNAEHENSAVFVPSSGLNAGYNGGFHFEARAENYLELGWRAGGAILEHGFVGSAAQGGDP